MSKDLKGYIKNSKHSEINKQKAAQIQSELSGKSQSEINSQFQTMLTKSKQNGTFNKGEMLKLLSGIKHNMPNAEYQNIKAIIEQL